MKNSTEVLRGFIVGVTSTATVVVLFVLGMVWWDVGYVFQDSRSVFPAPVSDMADVMTWQTVTIGGIVSFEIPSTCTLDPGAGNAYLICPTAENPQPTPEMNFSSDGITVNVHRWESLESPYWDHIVASMKVVQPMERDITINVQK